MQNFIRPEWTLFGELDGLCEKTGVNAKLLRRLILKELVDNALDECESCDVGLHSHGGYFISDHGRGISPDADRIANYFSISRPLTSSKLLRFPTRGALGNGLKCVAGAVLASKGRLVVHSHGKRHELTPKDDGTTHAETSASHVQIGTAIELWLGDKIPADPDALTWARQAVHLAAATERIYRGGTSIWWYDADSFWSLCRASQSATVRELIEELDGCTNSKATSIVGEFKGRSPSSLTREESLLIMRRARQISRKVNPSRLTVIGPDLWPGKAYFHTEGEITSDGEDQAILPYLIEACADRSDEDSIEMTINRTPIAGAGVTMYRAKDKREVVLHGCELNHRWTVGKQPLAVRMNLTTPHMRIISDGKKPDLSRYLTGIGIALCRVAKRAKNGCTPDKKPSQKSVIIANIATGSAKAGGDGVHIFGQRQLFYAVRNELLEQCGKASWPQFQRVITEYESEHGAIPKMTRDPRGTLIHPHTGESISLGTVAVDNYKRPAWNFNKILFVEKEGFFPLLRDLKWPERNDCALLTSKGYASRAARDVIDLLGETDETLHFFAIHDADKSGTLIYQSLVGATKARKKRKVVVHNLGLEPAEAVAMGLEIEHYKSKQNCEPAKYVKGKWRKWLNDKRVELNAMPTSQFIEWLDRKMEEAGAPGKLIPPNEVLEQSLCTGIREELRESITTRILREQDLDGKVDAAYAALDGEIAAATDTLRDTVEAAPVEDDESQWSDPIDELATEIVADEDE